MKETVFNILQITFGLLLITAILIQHKGSGLGSVFGGSGNVYSTKRGVDKILHYSTIVLAFLFFGASFSRLFF